MLKEVADRDAEQKFLQKSYADTRRRAAPTELVPGDLVLVRAPKKNKLSPKFDPHPFMVVGSPSPSEVSLRRGRSEIRRSVSAVQPVPPSPILEPASAVATGSEQQSTPHPSPGRTVNAKATDVALPARIEAPPSPPGEVAPSESSVVRSRSGREIRPPIRLDL